MLIRSLPEIHVSDEFTATLQARLAEVRGLPANVEQTPMWARPQVAIAAGLLLVAGFTYGLGFRTPEFRSPAPSVATRPRAHAPSREAVAATMPAGIPVWSAVVAAGQLPVHFAQLDFVESVPRR
jgi:hypothetical protein